MPNNGAISQTVSNGSTYTVPTGYHNGNGKISVPSLASVTSGTATAADIAKGKTAWVNGTKITGNNVVSKLTGFTGSFSRGSSSTYATIKFNVNSIDFNLATPIYYTVPTIRTVNGKALSADITLAAADVGASANSWTPTAPSAVRLLLQSYSATATSYGIGEKAL